MANNVDLEEVALMSHIIKVYAVCKFSYSRLSLVLKELVHTNGLSDFFVSLIMLIASGGFFMFIVSSLQTDLCHVTSLKVFTYAIPVRIMV